MIERALISVSDKSGVVDLAKSLHDLGIEIISTGGTHREIRSAGVPVLPIEEFTGSPEILDGRVKTLHPKIHGGILALRDKESHQADMKSSGIKPIDLLVVNLYPFEKVIHKREVLPEEVIENIDIGGVTLLRAGAKNFHYVATLSDPSDYSPVLSDIKKNKSVSEELRYFLAVKAFEMTANYDKVIFQYLGEKKFISFPRHD